MATIESMQREISKVLTDFATQLLNVFQNELAKQFAVQTASLPAGERGGRRKRAESDEKPARSRRARAAKPARAPRGKATRAASSRDKRDRSTPDEVNVLKGKILKLLKDSGEEIAAKDMEKKLSAPHGPFNYALNQLKKKSAVKQIGERRFARYSIGRQAVVDAVLAGSSGRAPKKGAARPSRRKGAAKAPEAAAPAEAEAQS